MPPKAVKLQEFLAHDGEVTSLYIGRKSAGVLVTGGDDRKVRSSLQKYKLDFDSPPPSATPSLPPLPRLPPSRALQVNVWLLGKPQPLLSLSGHASPISCVSFDRAEENVAAGSLAGTVKVRYRLSPLFSFCRSTYGTSTQSSTRRSGRGGSFLIHSSIVSRLPSFVSHLTFCFPDTRLLHPLAPLFLLTSLALLSHPCLLPSSSPSDSSSGTSR